MLNSLTVPTSGALMNPLLEAIKSLGGSASIEELNDKVAEVAGLTEEQLAVPHGENKGTEVAYRLAWTRTYLKQYGLLENSSRCTEDSSVVAAKLLGPQFSILEWSVLPLQHLPL